MLCVSIVAGATFALFETKDEINVSVGSANVKITATIGDLETYSYDATENAQIRTAANGTFTAGGTATVGANGSLVLDRIAAGDKVTFNLNVKNESNIKTKWRTVVKCLNGRELYDGLAITLGGGTKPSPHTRISISHPRAAKQKPLQCRSNFPTKRVMSSLTKIANSSSVPKRYRQTRQSPSYRSDRS
ncbi:MAG: hypothetical protein ACLUSP_06330 [Christensenellales bacterium]